MPQLSPLRKFALGPDTAQSIVDPTGEGRIYVVHLYNVNGVPLQSPDPSLRLRWSPFFGKIPCKPDPSEEWNDAKGEGFSISILYGTDWPKYGPTPEGKALAAPVYELDFAPFYAPCSGKLELISGAVVATVYAAVSHRRILPGERPPEWRYTSQRIEAGARFDAPKGAAGVLAPELSRTVDIVYGSGNKTVDLTYQTPWPLLGAKTVIPAVAGPLAFVLQL